MLQRSYTTVGSSNLLGRYCSDWSALTIPALEDQTRLFPFQIFPNYFGASQAVSIATAATELRIAPANEWGKKGAAPLDVIETTFYLGSFEDPHVFLEASRCSFCSFTGFNAESVKAKSFCRLKASGL